MYVLARERRDKKLKAAAHDPSGRGARRSAMMASVTPVVLTPFVRFRDACHGV